MDEVQLGIPRTEERDGQEFLVYPCGCTAWVDGSTIKILPCCPAHEQAVVGEVRRMLAEEGITPEREIRQVLTKH